MKLPPFKRMQMRGGEGGRGGREIQRGRDGKRRKRPQGIKREREKTEYIWMDGTQVAILALTLCLKK